MRSIHDRRNHAIHDRRNYAIHDRRNYAIHDRRHYDCTILKNPHGTLSLKMALIFNGLLKLRRSLYERERTSASQLS